VENSLGTCSRCPFYTCLQSLSSDMLLQDLITTSAPSSAVSSMVQAGCALATADAIALRKGMSPPLRCSATTLPATEHVISRPQPP
jgi:hypothetical protein